MTLEELESRVRVLEDIEAIKKMKARYSYFADAFNWEAFVDLFTDNGVVDFGSLGSYEGKVELLNFFKTSMPFNYFTHMFHNPIIEVKGEKATGEWYFEVPATHAGKNRAVWIVGKFEEKYVKVGVEWKINNCKAKIYFCTPYDEGWVKTPMFG